MLKFVEEYQSILNGVKGTTGEKKLAASFIPRFFKHFPDEHLNALNSLLDLCEDEDTAVSTVYTACIYISIITII